jgi:N-acetylmuramic acid 6-phosphate etherase
MATTETVSARYKGLDTWTDEAILTAFTDIQGAAIAAVRVAQPAIAEAAEAVAARSGAAGRLIYTGAGSSGVIAGLDGIELGGTFSWPDDRLAFVLANSSVTSGIVGGPEDDVALATSMMAALRLRPEDSIIAVAASGTTPFTLTTVDIGRKAGALTVGIANNRAAPLLTRVDFPILLETGAEVIAGSTRMGAGTAQKAALNMLSSLTMIRLGHIHDGMMVNLRIENAKLRKRAVGIIMQIAGCSEKEAVEALGRAGDRIKPAVLVARGVTPSDAEKLLGAGKGNLRTALIGLAAD